MQKLIILEKQKKRKKIFKIITVLIIPILGIIATIVFSGNKSKIDNSGDSAIIIANSKNTDIKYENNTKPTQIEEENRKYNQILSNKIHSFFENLNGDKEYQARNNIYKDLSRKFSSESIYEFCKNNQSIVLKDIPKQGIINNDKKIISNSFDVEIIYDYGGKNYTDLVNIKVRLDPNDIEEKEIHISRITCFEEQKGPFCEMFGY